MENESPAAANQPAATQPADRATPSKPGSRRVVATIVVLAVLAPLVATALCVDDWSRDLTTNTAHTGPGQKYEPWDFADTTEVDVADALQRVTEAESAWRLDGSVELPSDSPLPGVIDDDSVRATHHLTRTTRIMRYTDDVWLVVRPSDARGVTVYAESRSRVGKGDLGQNPRNLAELRELLTRALTGAS